MATLYEKLGGEPAISAVVDQFYIYMLSDDRVKEFFKNTDMDKQRKRQKQFITLVTGGPNKYEGVGMKEAHQKFKISKIHFDATWENLNLSLKHFKVASELVEELKEVFYSVEEDIVNSQ